LCLKEQVDAKKKALLEQLSKPSDISEDEALKRAAAIIKRGANLPARGRFPAGRNGPGVPGPCSDSCGGVEARTEGSEVSF
jgi:hypothetical protein